MIEKKFECQVRHVGEDQRLKGALSLSDVGSVEGEVAQMRHEKSEVLISDNFKKGRLLGAKWALDSLAPCPFPLTCLALAYLR